MASVVRLDKPRKGKRGGRGGGRLALMAVDFIPRPGGKRYRVRLGRCARADALRYCAMVERLVFAHRAGLKPDSDSAEWSLRLSPAHRGILERAGLLPSASYLASDPTLRRVCAHYLWARRGELSRSSMTQARRMVRSINDAMPRNPRINTITREDAKAWWTKMTRVDGLSEATARGRVRYANVMFGDSMHGAIGMGLITKNPLDQLPKNTVVRDKDDVGRARVLAVMEVCTPSKRLLLALARFAGLRVPSETHSLTWDRVDFENRVMRVRDIKRKRDRFVPIDPTLYNELTRALAAAPEGRTLVIDERPSNLNVYMKRAMIRAGVAEWEPVFHALRGSCETDWFDAGHPVTSVVGWMGHSAKVAMEHYNKTRLRNTSRVSGVELTEPDQGAAECAAHGQRTAAQREENGST